MPPNWKATARLASPKWQAACYNAAAWFPFRCLRTSSDMSTQPLTIRHTALRLTFSGHETFALRANWLKKAYDRLCENSDLFTQEDSFVHLGVGKNMAQSIRYWGNVCGVFERTKEGRYGITDLGHALLADDGWDPFLVTPAGRWLLHWKIASRPDAAFTWFFTFNLLRGGELNVVSLAESIIGYLVAHDYPLPSAATLSRDIDCMIHCYAPPSAKQLAHMAEDMLACPLTSLGLIQPLPGQNGFRLISGYQPDLPDTLVAFAVIIWMQKTNRHTAALHDLTFAPGSPGRVFRLDEDSLLVRLQQLEAITASAAGFSDTAGIRQVALRSNAIDLNDLLARAFADEARYG